MSVSIVLPCYNPPPGWADNVVRHYNSLKVLFDEVPEVILVQDGEAQATHADLETLRNAVHQFKNISYPRNQGKGYAIRKGVEVALGGIIIYTDIDFPYDDESIVKIYKSLRSGETELAVGIKNEDYYRHVPKARKLLSRLLSTMIRISLSVPVADTQCGLKGFTAGLKPLFLSTSINRYLFDLEFIRTVHRHKKKILTIPVQLNQNVQFRVMNYKLLFPEFVNFLKILLKRS